MTKDEFKKALDLMDSLFPKEELGKRFTQDASRAWYEALKDLDSEKVNDGLIRYAQENQWSPTIADIRKFAPKSDFGMTDEEFDRLCEKHMGADEW